MCSKMSLAKIKFNSNYLMVHLKLANKKKRRRNNLKFLILFIDPDFLLSIDSD